MADVKLSLKSRLSELAALQAAVEGFGQRNGLAAAVVFDLNLALEEIVTNVISYGFDDGREHDVDVELRRDGDVLTARVSDDGKPFDPLAAGGPDLSLPVEERPVGGLGIFLTRKVMDEVSYERRGGRNVLTMRKRAAPAVD